MIKIDIINEIKRRLITFYDLIESHYKVSGNYRCRLVLSNEHQWDIGRMVLSAKIKEIIKKSGLKFLGSGSSRVVLGYKKYAIKIEKLCSQEETEGRYLAGYSENQQELECYGRIIYDNTMKLLIIPILADFTVKRRLVLVYPQLKSLARLYDAGKHPNDRYNTHKETLITHYFTDAGVENMGVYKGEIFYIDYNIEDQYIEDENDETLAEANRLFFGFSNRIRKTVEMIEEMKSTLK